MQTALARRPARRTWPAASCSRIMSRATVAIWAPTASDISACRASTCATAASTTLPVATLLRIVWRRRRVPAGFIELRGEGGRQPDQIVDGASDPGAHEQGDRELRRRGRRHWLSQLRRRARSRRRGGLRGSAQRRTSAFDGDLIVQATQLGAHSPALHSVDGPVVMATSPSHAFGSGAFAPRARVSRRIAERSDLVGELLEVRFQAHPFRDPEGA